MLVFLCMIALSRTFGASLPIISNEIREESRLTAPVVQQYRLRTRFDIVWSCLSTLFVCTWVAIHPNIPPRGEGHIRSLWRRIKLMLWTLLVPELILIWAYRQWDAARYIAELFKDEGWTVTHGHFLIMGGFVRAGDDIVLDFSKLLLSDKKLGEPFEIAFPTITAEEIQDKARGDFLSKAIAILQSLWFIAQCVARGTQGLALTELELVTLALASLNGVMYYFWWDKPLGVKEPIKVYSIDVDPPKKIVLGTGREERFQASLKASSQLDPMERFLLRPFQRMRASTSGHFSSIISLCGAAAPSPSMDHRPSTKTLSVIKTFLHEQRKNLDFAGDEYLWFLYLPVYWSFLPIIALAESLAAIADSRSIKFDSTHVSTFYAPRTLSSVGDIGSLCMFAATAFGAFHLIAWQFHFPSHVEQLLWRIGSLVITIIPLIPVLAIPFIIFGLVLKERFGFHLPKLPITLPHILKSIMKHVLIIFFGIFYSAALVGYMLARLLLLTQAIVLLRKQPESAFYAINWSHFLPHIQ